MSSESFIESCNKSNLSNAAIWLPKELLCRFNDIKERLRHLHEIHPTTLQGYTPHGEQHYVIVESRVYQLIPLDSLRHEISGEIKDQLTDGEKFFLLASTWLHDIGMLRGIFEDDARKSDDTIREEHHERSQKYITEKFTSVKVFDSEKEIFGLLAKYHRRRCPISECKEEISSTEHGTIRIRLLAAYLRLADALHIDQTRTPFDSYAITLAYNIPMYSKLHWLRSMFVIGINIKVKERQIIVQLKHPSNIDCEIKSINSIYDAIIQDLNDELNTVKEVLIENGITYFLYIVPELHDVLLTEQIISDFKIVESYFSHWDNPSSSALTRMVIVSVKEIFKLHNPKDEIWRRFLIQINNDIEEILEQCPISKKKLTQLITTLKIQLKNHTASNDTNDDKILQCLEEMNKIIHPTKIKVDRSDDNTDNTKDYCAYLIRKLKENVTYTLTESIKSNPYTTIQNTEKTNEAIRHFITEIENRILKTRKCHLGLLTLVNSISDTINNNKLTAEYIETIENQRTKNRNQVRGNAQKYFSTRHQQLSDENDKSIKSINILIYGYSELVIKTICGFRDQIAHNLIDSILRLNPDDKGYIPIHKINIEEKASERFKIFVCEGQPKNKTNWGGRIIYHDGARYALSLSERGFKNIYIISDAIVGTLLINEGLRKDDSDYPHIDYIIVGANGFDKNMFLHSAGHTSVATIAEYAKSVNQDHKPILILSLLTEKFLAKYIQEYNEYSDHKSNQAIGFSNGWRIRNSFKKELVRNNIFISQDEALKKLLADANISLYNPREDVIPIKYVDVVIHENAWVEKPKNYTDDAWNGEIIANTGKTTSGTS